MSKLHFANLSFDEKSTYTLRENEKYLMMYSALVEPAMEGGELIAYAVYGLSRY